MHFTLKSILKIEDPEIREEKIDEFFINFSILNPNLYKSGNRKIIELITNTEDTYELFKKMRGNKEWEIFWNNFYSLHILLEYDYWKNFNALYSDYRWFQKTLTSNIFIRIWHEIIHFLFQASQFSVIASGLLVYFSIWDSLFIHNFPSGTISSALSILLSSILFYSLLMIIGANTNGLKKQNESFFKYPLLWVINLSKRVTSGKLENFWSNKFKKHKKIQEVPQMYILHKD